MLEAESRQPSLLVTAFIGVLGYLRWTQLVPMLVAWVFLLIMVGAMLLVNFQDQSFALAERGIGLYERVFGPLEPVGEPVREPGETAAPEPTPDQAHSADGDSASGAVHFSGDDIVAWLTPYWLLASLAGWLLGGLRSMLFGPRPGMPLPRKLIIAAAAAALCSVGFFVSWLFGSEAFEDNPVGWVALFLGMPFLVWLVSAWCLSVAHLLDHLAGVMGDTTPASYKPAPE